MGPCVMLNIGMKCKKMSDEFTDKNIDCTKEQILKCPECNENYNHILSFTYYPPADDWVAHQRFHISDRLMTCQEDDFYVGYRIREGCMETNLKCENCETEWSYIIAFHKGQVFTNVKKIEQEN